MGSGRPFYKNLRDTLEDVDIKAHQLTYWRKKGLFTPELGPTSKVFTQDDVKQLRLLRRLIVDLRLPVETIRKFQEQAAREVGLGDDPARDKRYLDFLSYLNLNTGELVSEWDVEQALLSGLKGSRLDELLLTLAMVRFEEFRRTHGSSAKLYKAARDELLDSIRRVDLVARATATRLSLSLDDDPDLGPAELEALADERRRRSKGIPNWASFGGGIYPEEM